MSNSLKWQTRDEMPYPTNPLQKLRESLTYTSKDMGIDKLDAFMYAVIVGWDDDSLEELRLNHNWSDEDVLIQKQYHDKFNELWNKFFEL